MITESYPDPSRLKIIAGGGGSASKSNRPAIEQALLMATKEKPNVLIIPTPKRTREAFDKTVPGTQRFFKGLGLKTELLHNFGEEIEDSKAGQLIEDADVIYTTGGDTLHMMDELRTHKLCGHIGARAMKGHVVLSGISAGAILPMQWGLSDSLSYRPDTADNWQYIKVDGLSLVQAAITPHFGSSNPRLGPRSKQFSSMVTKENTPLAFGIDNLAAIQVSDGQITQLQSDPSHYVHIAQRSDSGEITFQPLSNTDAIDL